MERSGRRIKLGQMMSVRPTCSARVLAELATLQDAVAPFDSAVARAASSPSWRSVDVFSELSAEPVAAASLAQVYRGVLRASGDVVAVKVQHRARDRLEGPVRAAARGEVYQGLVERFAPRQRTDYVALGEWAVGF